MLKVTAFPLVNSVATTTKFVSERSYAFETYPNFVKAAIARPENYNKSVETLNQLEKDNKIFVLAPEIDIIPWPFGLVLR